MPLAGLDVGQELQEAGPVEAFRKALLGHQSLGFQHLVRIEETVGRDQIHLGRCRPAGQQLPENARRGRLADRDGTRNADDERRLAVVMAEKRLGCLMDADGGFGVEGQKARQGQVDGFHLLDGDGSVETLQLRHFLFGERHRRVGAQPRPLAFGEHAIGGQIHVQTLGNFLIHVLRSSRAVAHRRTGLFLRP